MVDREKIESLIRHLRRYTTYLQEITQQGEEEFLRDPKSTGSARYYLQVSIETYRVLVPGGRACINIANHIIATENLRAPKDYKDSFQVLNEADILPDTFTRAMQELAGLRNLIVHIYWEIDDRMIYEGIQFELSDFEGFVEYILQYLDRQLL